MFHGAFVDEPYCSPSSFVSKSACSGVQRSEDTLMKRELWDCKQNKKKEERQNTILTWCQSPTMHWLIKWNAAKALRRTYAQESRIKWKQAHLSVYPTNPTCRIGVHQVSHLSPTTKTLKSFVSTISTFHLVHLFSSDACCAWCGIAPVIWDETPWHWSSTWTWWRTLLNTSKNTTKTIDTAARCRYRRHNGFTARQLVWNSRLLSHDGRSVGSSGKCPIEVAT